MTLNKLTACATLVLAALATSPAHSQSITNTDGTLTPFSGFNWSAAGAGWTNGFTTAANELINNANPTDFTIRFVSHADGILKPNQTTFDQGFLDKNGDGVRNNAANSYEYSVLFTITATLTDVTATSAKYIITSALFDIYYDSALANLTIANPGNVDGLYASGAAVNVGAARTGFTDGARILSGTMVDDKGFGFEESFSDTGTNTIGLTGAVTYTNTDFVNPTMIGSRISSTVQFGAAAAGLGNDWIQPTSVAGFGNTNCTAAEDEVCFQAQGNQTFSPIPEPGSLLMVGLALAGLGVSSRRARAKR